MNEDKEKKYKNLVTQTARECFDKMSPDDIAYLRMHRSTLYHMEYSLYIRNDCLGKFYEELDCFIPDDVSGDILKRIIRLALPEYRNVPIFYEYPDFYGPLRDFHCYILDQDGSFPYLVENLC